MARGPGARLALVLTFATRQSVHADGRAASLRDAFLPPAKGRVRGLLCSGPVVVLRACTPLRELTVCGRLPCTQAAADAPNIYRRARQCHRIRG